MAHGNRNYAIYSLKVEPFEKELKRNGVTANFVCTTLGRNSGFFSLMKSRGVKTTYEKAEEVANLLGCRVDDIFEDTSLVNKPSEGQIQTSTGLILDKPTQPERVLFPTEKEEPRDAREFFLRKRSYEEIQKENIELLHFKQKWLAMKDWVSELFWSDEQKVDFNELAQMVRTIERTY